jgi:hypothetical protein
MLHNSTSKTIHHSGAEIKKSSSRLSRLAAQQGKAYHSQIRSYQELPGDEDTNSSASYDSFSFCPEHRSLLVDIEPASSEVPRSPSIHDTQGNTVSLVDECVVEPGIQADVEADTDEDYIEKFMDHVEP